MEGKGWFLEKQDKGSEWKQVRKSTQQLPMLCGLLSLSLLGNSMSLAVYHRGQSFCEGGVDPELQTKVQIPLLQTQGGYTEATAADIKPDAGVPSFLEHSVDIQGELA